jgi:hypothetical protein
MFCSPMLLDEGTARDYAIVILRNQSANSRDATHRRPAVRSTAAILSASLLQAIYQP